MICLGRLKGACGHACLTATAGANVLARYSAAQLYNIVSDIPSYSSFIPFCTSSTVLAPLPVPDSASSSPSSSPSSRASAGRRRAETGWKPTEEPFDVEAELKVGFGGLEEAYVSKVTGRPFEMVRAEAAEEAALFKSLVTTCMWALVGLVDGTDGCAVGP